MDYHRSNRVSNPLVPKKVLKWIVVHRLDLIYTERHQRTIRTQVGPQRQGFVFLRHAQIQSLMGLSLFGSQPLKIINTRKSKDGTPQTRNGPRQRQVVCQASGNNK